MGLRRSVIHGILLGFPFFAVYIYRTIYRANYFSGTADFVHFQLTFGALAALCAYLFLYKCVVVPLWDFIRHGTKQRVADHHFFNEFRIHFLAAIHRP